jgi:RNA polymerase sigma-70 factor, ECF subfamily
MPVTPGTDEELIAEYRQSGDTGCLDELVVRHTGKVRAMIYTMVLNEADADDLTQEVFLRAVRHIGSFRREARFSTWLYRIAVNTTRSHLKRRRSPLDGFNGDQPESAGPLALEPDNAIMNGELDGEISRALAGLPPDLRAAITLTVIQGMDVREAASVAGCLRATMYWRVHEARKRLKRRLGEHLEP